jgi:aminoglycoside 6'-N-acetyltransferase
MITLRPATLHDLPLLRQWDTQPHVIESDPNDDWNWSVELQRSPEWREQLIAQLDKRPIGFVQIIDPLLEETHYWGEVPENLRAIDIWIGNEDDLGKGYGTQIMKLALNRCFSSHSVKAVWIDPLTSNTKAIRFYEGMGFRFVEHRRLGEDDCSVYCITREEWIKASL